MIMRIRALAPMAALSIVAASVSLAQAQDFYAG
jgi:hypothetical protein